MLVQLYCDDTLVFTFDGNREETSVALKQAAHELGLSIDDEFELQNRLTVLFLGQGHNNLSYQTDRARFTLRTPEKDAEKTKGHAA